MHSPSAKRRQGLSPYSKSSRHRDLQNSGLALLKKTTALLKNPPAVTNYKALNFDLGQGQEPEADQQTESQKVSEYNTNRKGVILRLYRKNSGAFNSTDREAVVRTERPYPYQRSVGAGNGRRQST